jgi:hypothetical protein
VLRCGALRSNAAAPRCNLDLEHWRRPRGRVHVRAVHTGDAVHVVAQVERARLPDGLVRRLVAAEQAELDDDAVRARHGDERAQPLEEERLEAADVRACVRVCVRE